MTCRFCSAPALARFALSEGCVCHPGDREQSLCAQHIVRASPLGSMELLEVHDADGWRWFTESRGVQS